MRFFTKLAKISFLLISLFTRHFLFPGSVFSQELQQSQTTIITSSKVQSISGQQAGRQPAHQNMTSASDAIHTLPDSKRDEPNHTALFAESQRGPAIEIMSSGSSKIMQQPETVTGFASENYMPNQASVLGNMPNLIFDTGFSFYNQYFYVSFNHEIQLSARAKNDGNASAGAFRIGFYLSTDSTITTEDFLIKGFATDSLGVGKVFSVSKEKVNLDTLANLAPGMYYVGVILDDQAQVDESAEDDNAIRFNKTFFYPGSTPNLVLDPVLLGSYSYSSSSQELTISMAYRNTGGDDSGPFHLGFYFSEDKDMTTDDFLISSVELPNLREGGFSSIFHRVALDTLDTIPSGTFYVGVIIDHLDEVDESDETDNAHTFEDRFTFNNYPDLAIKNGTLNRYTFNRTTGALTVITTVSNTGLQPAGPFHVSYGLSLNRSSSPADFNIGESSHAGLDDGESITDTLVVDLNTIDGLPNGPYYISFYFDNRAEVRETNESNNGLFFTQSIQFTSTRGAPALRIETTEIAINEPGGTMSNIARKPKTPEPGEYVPGRLIVKFQTGPGLGKASAAQNAASIQALNRKYQVQAMNQLVPESGRGLAKKRDMGLHAVYLLRTPETTNIWQMAQDYSSDPNVIYAEPDYFQYGHTASPRGIDNNKAQNNTARVVPNDPFYPRQWGLNNVGQADPFGSGDSVGTTGVDINAEQAWSLQTGSEDVIVAVIDAGMDFSHPEFAGRLVPGYDFVDNDDDPSEVDNAHGIAVAGIIAAAGNNGIGVAGIAWNVKIMPLRTQRPDGSGTIAASSLAMIWAADHGAKIINMSIVGRYFSQFEEEAANYAYDQDVLLLASSGNKNSTDPQYPAGYASVISVGALSPCGTRKRSSSNPGAVSKGVTADPLGVSCDNEYWWGSNYGAHLDFLAPGTRIYTTDLTGELGYRNGDYTETFNGTSAACPYASGVAALIRSENPSLTNAEVRAIMQSTAIDLEAPGFDEQTGYGQLDAYMALLAARGESISGFFEIHNVGLSPLLIKEITSDKNWLIPSFQTATVETATSRRLTVAVNWAGVGYFPDSATLTVTSNDEQTPSLKLKVNATPLPRAVLNASPGNFDFPATSGSGTIQITNTGSATLNYTATVTAGSDWLSITGGGTGTDDSNIQFSYAANDGVTPRKGSIEISAEDAVNSPITITFSQINGRNFWKQVDGPFGGTVQVLHQLENSTILMGTFGAGAYVSKNNGTQWQPINSGLPRNNIYDYVVDSQNVIYAATESGVFKSNSSDLQWAATGEGIPEDRTVRALHISQDGALFAGVSAAGIYKSTSGGNTWVAISPDFQNRSVYDIAEALDGTLYVATSRGVYKSANSGGSWSPVNTGAANGKLTTEIFILPTGAIFIDAGSLDVLRSLDDGLTWVQVNTGLPSSFFSVRSFFYENGVLYAATSSGLYRTSNNGDNWEVVSETLSYRALNTLIRTKSGGLLTGSNGSGVFHSSDDGATWQNSNDGLNGIFIWSLVNNTAGDLFAGTSRDGIFRSTDAGQTWQQVFIEQARTGVSVLTLDADENIIASVDAFGLFRSKDNGSSWENITGDLPANGLRRAALPLGPGQFMVTVSNNGIFRTDDDGVSWQKKENGAPTSDGIALLQKSSGEIFVGTRRDGVFISTDNGESWQAANTGLETEYISSLAGNTRGQLFAGTVFNGLFRSDNNGESWQQIGAEIPTTLILTLSIDAEGIVWVGTRSGVFFSEDAGDTWTELNSGLRNTNISSFAYNKNGGIVLGTYGAGIFIENEANPTNVTDDPTQFPGTYTLHQNYPNPFNPETTIEFALPQAGHVTLVIYNILGQKVATLIDGKISAGIHKVQWQPRDLPSGLYFYHIQAGEFQQTRKLTFLK